MSEPVVFIVDDHPGVRDSIAELLSSVGLRHATFESAQQYERSLRLPLGPEWTTKKSYQDATKPRVLMRQGVIRPMERPLV